MKDNHIFLVILCFFYIGCQEKTNTSKNVSILNDKYKDSSFNSIIKKFGLPYQGNFRLDSNSLIFYGTRNFDTSFLIHLKQGVAGINGVYYEVLPTYHNNVNDFVIPEKGLLFFEGYSFILDSIKWEILKSKAEKMLVSDTSFKSNKGCRDCEEYVLCYNLKSSKSNLDTISKYQLFYKFLKDLVLEDFIQRRKPKMHKIK